MFSKFDNISTQNLSLRSLAISDFSQTSEMKFVCYRFAPNSSPVFYFCSQSVHAKWLQKHSHKPISVPLLCSTGTQRHQGTNQHTYRHTTFQHAPKLSWFRRAISARSVWRTVHAKLKTQIDVWCRWLIGSGNGRCEAVQDWFLIWAAVYLFVRSKTRRLFITQSRT